jgi:hypothetical protein
MPTTDCAGTLQTVGDLFAKYAGSNLWHGAILSTSWVRSEDGPDPWELVGSHEPLAACPVLGPTPIELRDGGALDGRFFGDGERLAAFCQTADAAYRCLQESPLREFADRAVPQWAPRSYADCWLGIVYSLAWEHESPLLLVRERNVAEWVGSLEASESYHVTFAFMERDVFTTSLAAVKFLQGQAGESNVNGGGRLPEAGQVTDDSAYRPAKRFLDGNRFRSHKRLSAALKRNPWIRTRKPSPQRLEVHAGDWDRYLAMLDEAGFDALDVAAETADAFLTEVRRRQEEIRRRKAGG